MTSDSVVWCKRVYITARGGNRCFPPTDKNVRSPRRRIELERSKGVTTRNSFRPLQIHIQCAYESAAVAPSQEEHAAGGSGLMRAGAAAGPHSERVRFVLCAALRRARFNRLREEKMFCIGVFLL